MQQILVERKPGYAIVTLNDPDRRNVMTLEMSALIETTFDDLEADESVNAVIVTGSGKGFCAGGHLDELLANPGDAGLRRIYAGFVRIANSPLPTIAAVNGAAVGAGMNTALACDVIIASDRARFDSRFLQIAISPGGGHTWRLRTITDLQTVRAMVLFGEVLDGPRAAEVGLAWKCVPHEELLTVSEEMAAKTGTAPRELVLRTKQVVERSVTVNDIEAAIDNEIDTQAWAMNQPAFEDMVKNLKARIANPTVVRE